MCRSHLRLRYLLLSCAGSGEQCKLEAQSACQHVERARLLGRQLEGTRRGPKMDPQELLSESGIEAECRGESAGSVVVLSGVKGKSILGSFEY